MPVAPVVPEFGLLEGTVLGVVELGEPLPVAPIDDVEPGVLLLPLAVVSVLLDVLPAVLGVVFMLPDPVVEPVVVEGVDGVVLLVLLVEESVEPVEPVGVSALRWQALRERAAAIASAMTVYWVFIRNSLFGVSLKVARAAATAL